MQLTEDQAETARTLGCRFVPATEAQVRQFSMQRRVFTIGGAPFLAARQDGFYETAGTLLALIADAVKQRDSAAQAEPEQTPEAGAETAAAVDADVDANTGTDVFLETGDVEVVPQEVPEPAAAPAMARAVAHEPIDFPPPTVSAVRGIAVVPAAPVMAATVTIVKGYARRGTLDTGSLTALVATVHQTLLRLR